MNKENLEWAFKAIIIGIATYCASQFTELKNSVIDLNTKIAVLVTQSGHQAEQIKENKKNIEKIKEKI